MRVRDVVTALVLVVLAVQLAGAQAPITISNSIPSFPILAPNGSDAAPSYAFATGTSSGLDWDGTNLRFAVGGALVMFFNSTSLTLASGATFAWFNDVFLTRDAAAVLALKNPTPGAASLRVYGSATQYLSVGHDGTNAQVDTSATAGALVLGGTNATAVGVGAAPATALTKSLFLTATTFANLATPSNGSMTFCSDCDPPTLVDATCASVGTKTGSLAFRVNGAWKCLG